MDPTAFYDLVVKEITQNLLRLDDQQSATLAGYYRSMMGYPDRLRFYRYNWSRRVTPMLSVVQTLPRREHPWRILDAGCGVGTESIFFGLCRSDFEITGVDISERRLTAANARKTAYETYLNRDLSIRFTNQDVFDVLTSGRYDLIWSMEAISHIDPAERFIEAAFKSLEDKGFLVVSDTHSLNPVVAWRIYRHRLKVGERSVKIVTGGKRVSYAHERLFSVPQLSSLLRGSGFGQVSSQISIFFPPSLTDFVDIFKHMEPILDRIPLMRYAGGVYTITARKV